MAARSRGQGAVVAGAASGTRPPWATTPPRPPSAWVARGRSGSLGPARPGPAPPRSHPQTCCAKRPHVGRNPPDPRLSATGPEGHAQSVPMWDATRRTPGSAGRRGGVGREASLSGTQPAGPPAQRNRPGGSCAKRPHVGRNPPDPRLSKPAREGSSANCPYLGRNPPDPRAHTPARKLTPTGNARADAAPPRPTAFGCAASAEASQVAEFSTGARGCRAKSPQLPA